MALPAITQSWSQTRPVVGGAYHVHSRRSDGTGTLDEIAAAAAAASLQFVIITDHGDGTRRPEPPTYRSGVLVLDGVEISTADGHYVVIGLPQAPFKLAGTAQAVAEDVRRLGGLGLVAHPDSRKPELRWTAEGVPVDGLEWLNADSEWRDELWRSIGKGLLTYPFRPAETLVSLIDRPHDTLARWANMVELHRTVALAGADAHARLGLGSAREPYDDPIVARVPSYRAAFGAFRNHLILRQPLTGQADADAATIRAAIAGGHAFTTLDGLAAAGAFELAGSSGSTRAGIGDYLEIAGPVVLEGRVDAPSLASFTVYRGDVAIYDTYEPQFRIDVGGMPGAYRVEATLRGRARQAVPWLLSNPIYVGLRARHVAAAQSPSPEEVSERVPVDTTAWTREVSVGSESDFRQADLPSTSAGGLWQFALASTAGTPYAAVRFLIGHLRGFNRVLLTAHSRRPARLWLQLRSPEDGNRWGQTFYVDEQPRAIAIFFDDLRPIGHAETLSSATGKIDSLLFVADTLNHVPGGSGEVVIRDLSLAR